jgi:hypothetical protein
MRQTAENFQRTEAIFQEAIEVPEAERANFIEARCGGDRELAAEVWSLLNACEEEARIAGPSG